METLIQLLELVCELPQDIFTSSSVSLDELEDDDPVEDPPDDDPNDSDDE